MTTQPNDGGPVYPSASPQWIPDHPGMSLRDWFAGQAIGAIIIASQGVNNVTRDDTVAEAYQLADAMLRARTGGKDGEAQT